MVKRNGNRGGNRPSGGIGSRVNREVPVRYGQRAEEIRHQGVSQIGQNLGDHLTDHRKPASRAVEPVRGALRPAGTPGSVMLGNQKALDVGKGGVGTGRTVMRSGSQCQTGPANPGLGRITNTKGQWPD